MGTAGFGAALEHSLPILFGGLRPDGLGKEDGLVESADLTDAGAVLWDVVEPGGEVSPARVVDDTACCSAASLAAISCGALILDSLILSHLSRYDFKIVYETIVSEARV